MGTSSSSPAGSFPSPPTSAPTPAQDDSSCPVPAEYRNPVVYNVYGEVTNDPSRPPASSANPLQALQSTQVLDPRNNMPLEANQAPCAGQRKPLLTERVQSTIPKGGTASTWQFPSPQMVFNALRRKNKGEDVTEDDMEGFVNAHNGGDGRARAHANVHARPCAPMRSQRMQTPPAPSPGRSHE